MGTTDAPPSASSSTGSVKTLEELLWTTENEALWRAVYIRYRRYVRSTHQSLEDEIEQLQLRTVQTMSAREWFDFLSGKYFRWKFTDGRVYAANLRRLERSLSEEKLGRLNNIKDELLSYDGKDVGRGLLIASKIDGLSVSAGSGLLAVLFPATFGTVDRYVAQALQAIESLKGRGLEGVKPNALRIEDAVLMIELMREKALQLNRQFDTGFWTPRRVDMVLWTLGH